MMPRRSDRKPDTGRGARPGRRPCRGSLRGALLAAVAVAAAAGLGGPTQAAAQEAGGVRIWNADPWQWLGPDAQGGGPGSPGPIRLVAPQNGVASGQVVVSGASGLRGLSGKASDLGSPGGATIPAAALRVRYARLGAAYIPLLDAPADGAKAQPIWVTVKVPADARPGEYRGGLQVLGLDRPVTVPIELTVAGWKVGDPKDWKTWVNILQSPESVAGHYKVPMWSDEHFRLMEKSFELMGLCGNEVLGVSAVGKSVFGDDPLIVFRKEGGRHVPELGFLERYLELYDRHAGAPKLLCVHVWNYGMYYRGTGRDGGSEMRRASTIPVVELQGGRLVPVEMPIYGEPGTEEIWRAVMDGLRERLKRLGWGGTRILIGTSGDTWPSEITVRFFQKIAPDVQWRVLTHGCGCPKWGRTVLERTQPNEMVVGYLEIARRLVDHRDRLEGHPVVCNCRDDVGSHPFTFRGLAPVTTIKANYEGICWKGLDYWDFTTPEGTVRNALNTYVQFGNMVGRTPRAMAAAGPQGAVWTAQLEMLREGIQDCEAMLAIRDGLKVLYPRPVQKFDVAQLLLRDALYREDRGEGDRDLELALHYQDGRLRGEALPKATTYNTGAHKGQAAALPGPEGLKVEVQVTIGDDAWVRGGQGKYLIEIKRTGDSYAGAYTGTYNGRPRRGAVTGTFVREGFTQPLGSPPPKDERFRRCEAAIGEMLARLGGGEKAGGAGLWPLLARLHAAAAEVAAAGGGGE